MQTVYSDKHSAHFPKGELYCGAFVTPFERPSRMEYILNRLRETGRGAVLAPGPLDMAPVQAVHDGAYLRFLETAFAEWRASGKLTLRCPPCGAGANPVL